MIVLGIETSCDETSVGIVENGKHILSEVTHSQIEIHRTYGGVVPEIAAREHCTVVDSTIYEALKQANLKLKQIDRIAVVNGPGLVSSLLTGVTAAKTLAWATETELVTVNHLQAHICASHLQTQTIDSEFEAPFVCLLASGGHTQLLYVVNYQNMQLLGETLDDSAGEAFDKVARMLGLDYPGGPAIEKLALAGNKEAFKLPKPKVGEFEFSFSGLKTAVLRLIQSLPQDYVKADLAASFQETVCQELGGKLLKAAEEHNCKQIVIAGGVAANERLRTIIKEMGNLQIKAPALRHCTDNGAMVAAAGYLCPQTFGLNFKVFSRNKMC
jgi:N6-L-threonylcarbamoyladenine synthase